MPVIQYRDTGLVMIPEKLNTDKIVGRSVLMTGGAGGLGQAYTEAFIAAGAYVTITDLNEQIGTAFASKLGSNAQFCKVDVTNWDEQVAAFEAAVQNSPNKRLDIVISNAGIIGNDDMSAFEVSMGAPKKPNLNIVNINLLGTLYTVKLALHYFRRQPVDPSYDSCLIMKSSLAAYVDLPGSVQYNVSKFGVRGAMNSLRRTLWKQGIRVNTVAPWYVLTPIIPEPVQHYLKVQGVGFATTEDASKAMLLIASDPSINGRSIGVVSRIHDANGYLDLGLDDYKPGSLYAEWQQIVLDTARALT